MDLWESDWQWSLGGMPARLPTASWLSDFLNCEGVAVHPWEEPDAYLQAIFDHGTQTHEAAAVRYLNLEPVVEPGSRVDVESRTGAALIPELEPISEAGVVEAAFELLPDKVVAHVVTDGKMPRKAQHGGLFGRMDYVGKDIDGRLWVLDLKTGNPDYLQMPLLAWQLRHYACMAWEHVGKPAHGCLMSYAAVRAGCREHTWGPWEAACPSCRAARPTAHATAPLLETWAVQLRKALVRAQELVAGAPPVYKPSPRQCARCRAKASCPASLAPVRQQDLPVVTGT